jgi:hypothetical protein
MDTSLGFIHQPVGKGLVVGLDDLVTGFCRDREERGKRASEVAEFFVLPVKESLENLDGQRFA